jgi:hypothetical protein
VNVGQLACSLQGHKGGIRSLVNFHIFAISNDLVSADPQGYIQIPSKAAPPRVQACEPQRFQAGSLRKVKKSTGMKTNGGSAFNFK